MKNEFKKIMREQVQESIDPFSGLVQLATPRMGWIRTIREALGLSGQKLSERLECSKGNVAKVEKSEREGTITLNTLKKAAQALNCKVVYCLIPEESFEQTLTNRARTVARYKIRYTNHSMLLEDQGLTPKQLQQQEDLLVQRLLHGNPSKLWNNYDI